MRCSPWWWWARLHAQLCPPSKNVKIVWGKMSVLIVDLFIRNVAGYKQLREGGGKIENAIRKPHREESVCIKAAYILPRFLSPTLTHWEELILPAGSSSLLLPGSAESSGFKTHPDTHMHNRWAVPLLTAHEYKAGPAASSVERGKISFSIHWPLCFFSPSRNYFSTLGENTFYHCQVGRG